MSGTSMHQVIGRRDLTQCLVGQFASENIASFPWWSTRLVDYLNPMGKKASVTVSKEITSGQLYQDMFS